MKKKNNINLTIGEVNRVYQTYLFEGIEIYRPIVVHAVALEFKNYPVCFALTNN